MKNFYLSLLFILLLDSPVIADNGWVDTEKKITFGGLVLEKGENGVTQVQVPQGQEPLKEVRYIKDGKSWLATLEGGFVKVRKCNPT